MESKWITSSWMLVMSIYGAMDVTSTGNDIRHNIIQQIQNQLAKQRKSIRPSKTQTGQSVSAGDVHPDQRGQVITPQSLTPTHTRDAGDGVAITLSHNNIDIQGIWYYAPNSLKSVITTLVQSWRNLRVL
jgi:hypothetical protein